VHKRLNRSRCRLVFNSGGTVYRRTLADIPEPQGRGVHLHATMILEHAQTCIKLTGKRQPRCCLWLPVLWQLVTTVMSTNVCLSVSHRAYLLQPLVQTKFHVRVPATGTRSSSGAVAICYVIPVLWNCTQWPGIGVVKKP